MDVITLAMAKGYADEKLETAKAYTDEKLSEVGGNGGGQGGSATPPLDLYAQVDVSGDISTQITAYKDSSYNNKLNGAEIDNAVAEGRSIRVIVEVFMGNMKYTDVLVTPLYVMYGGGAMAIVHTINPLAEGTFGTLAFACDY